MGWRWISQDVVLAVHSEQLVIHGGGNGIRDLALLESALARPHNLVAYGNPDIADLAASYAYGIARNHPFVDGNKRTAFVVGETFMLLNGYQLTAIDVECVLTFLALAAGDMTEEALADWYRQNSASL